MTTKKKTKAKKKSIPVRHTTQDIPLDNIPERSKARRTFTDDFKIKAANRVIEGGESVDNVAASLDIGEGSLRRWVRSIQAGEPVSAVPRAPRTPGAPRTRTAAAEPKSIDATFGSIRAVRAALAQAMAARDERLEIAATIVEFEGYGASGDHANNLAMQIRDMRHKRDA